MKKNVNGMAKGLRRWGNVLEGKEWGVDIHGGNEKNEGGGYQVLDEIRNRKLRRKR
jgi:hypothetical protein